MSEPKPATAATNPAKKPAAAVADWLKAAKQVVPILSEGQFLELAGAREPVEVNATRKVRLPALAAAAEALRAAATAAVEPYLAGGPAFLCEVRFDHRNEITVEFRAAGGDLDLTLHFPPVLPAAAAAKAKPEPAAKPAKEAAAKAKA